MSKKKYKDVCCCCCDSGYGVGGSDIFGGDGCGIWAVIIFWLIACGAGLLNNNSILIILLFLLYGCSGEGSIF